MVIIRGDGAHVGSRHESVGNRRGRVHAAIGLMLFLAAGAARADGPGHAFGLVEGDGTLGSHLSDRNYIGLVYDWDWSPAWTQKLPGAPFLYPEFNLSHWHGCAGPECGHVTEIGLTGALRWDDGAGRIPWYIDAGVGGHLLSDTRIGPQVYSTAFQFSEFAGLGWLVGSERYDLGLRFMHESNGDWKKPNDGMSFLLLRLAVRW